MPLPVTFFVVFGGIFGLIIGSFLNVVVYRVPAGVSLMRESRCPSCEEPVRPWQNVPVVSWVALRGRCASCGNHISARYPLVEITTGLAFAATVWWTLVVLAPLATTPPLASLVLTVAYLYFAAITIVLTLIDLDTRRLPNEIVLPSYVVGIVLLTTASLFTGDWAALLRGAIGMAAMYLLYFVLRTVRPGGMGGGDVKLAGVVGMYLAYVGWGALVVGAFAAFVLGGVFGIVLMLLHRAGRKTAIPFGPWMLAGAWCGIFAGESIARWYTGIFASV